MLDHDDLYSNLIKNNESSSKFTEYITTLKEFCEKHSYIFFDVYEKYCDENGFLNVKYSDGNCHVSDPIYIQEFIINNLKK